MTAAGYPVHGYPGAMATAGYGGQATYPTPGVTVHHPGVVVHHQAQPHAHHAHVGMGQGAAPQPPVQPGSVTVAPGSANAQQPDAQNSSAKLHSLLKDLLVADHRETVLFELSKCRDQFQDLAVAVWYSVGTIAVLLQEIIAVYPSLTPPTLQTGPSNRVCNALALLQLVAQHNDTRAPFLHAGIPLFLYPFLNTSSTDKPFEYLRLTSLGVIGALVKSDDHEVIAFLLQTEIVPLCLKIMESGTELSRTVATFVVQKVLHFDNGLHYVCATPERFVTVARVLRAMVCTDQCTTRLLRHIIRCYLRLAEHPRARDALKQCLPDSLKNNTFQTIYAEDPSIAKIRQQLLQSLADPPTSSA